MPWIVKGGRLGLPHRKRDVLRNYVQPISTAPKPSCWKPSKASQWCACLMQRYKKYVPYPSNSIRWVWLTVVAIVPWGISQALDSFAGWADVIAKNPAAFARAVMQRPHCGGELHHIALCRSSAPAPLEFRNFPKFGDHGKSVVVIENDTTISYSLCSSINTFVKAGPLTSVKSGQFPTLVLQRVDGSKD